MPMRLQERSKIDLGDYDTFSKDESIRVDRLLNTLDSQKTVFNMPNTIDPQTVANLKSLINEADGEQEQDQIDSTTGGGFTLDKDGSLHKKHRVYDSQRKTNDVSVYVQSNQ